MRSYVYVSMVSVEQSFLTNSTCYRNQANQTGTWYFLVFPFPISVPMMLVLQRDIKPAAQIPDVRSWTMWFEVEWVM